MRMRNAVGAVVKDVVLVDLGTTTVSISTATRILTRRSLPDPTDQVVSAFIPPANHTDFASSRLQQWLPSW
jgi:hypothetical protein